jgi:phosphatidylinositol alpha-1,6-mannosyltransferase
VFCVSDYSRSHVARLAPSAVTETLTCGLDVDRLGATPDSRSSFTPPTGIPRLLTVARLAPRKGHRLLIDALAKVQRPFIWDIVGTGPLLAELDAAIDLSTIAERTIMHGGVDDEQLALLFRQCDLFVLTPIEVSEGDGIDAEGFGLVYLEAAAHGKASVGSVLGGCGEAIEHGVTGLAVDPRDTASLALSVDTLLASLELRQAMGLAAFRRLKSDFRIGDRAATLLRYYDVYRALPSRGKRRAERMLHID